MSINRSPHDVVGVSRDAKMESLVGKGGGYLQSGARADCPVSPLSSPHSVMTEDRNLQKSRTLDYPNLYVTKR